MADRPPAPEPSTRLPRELVLLYLLGPFFITPVVEGGFFDGTPREMLLALARNAAFFLPIPAGIHALYRFVMPSLLARVRGPLARVATHAVMTGLVALAGGVAVTPIVALLSEDPPDSTILFRCVVLTWAVVFPALVVERLRRRAAETERRLHEQRQAALSAQLEAIRSRTNPHFLFNAMNTIASLIQDDPRLAERTTERLAEVLRYALQSARLESVTLGDELAMVRDYLDIQRARFGDRLRYTIELEPGLERVQVPPLLVQPLIENAVLHGVGERPEGGSIRVEARRRGAGFELRVEDDGPGPGASAHRGSGTSLGDLARRLELDGRGSLVIRTSDLGGFCVELALPEADPVKILVVDDEAPARRRLVRMLEEIPDVQIAGEAADGLAALAAVERTAPDLLMLDVNMPGIDGLALAARYAHLPPVVFVTAHDQHAVRAFEVNAVDYLLKPVRPERLAEAVGRAAARLLPARDGFRALPIGGRGDAPRVVTHERGVVRLFDAAPITRFRAIDKYTAFVVDGEEHLTEEPLSQLEQRLGPHGFVRVHRSELVATSAIRALDTDDGGHRALLADGQIARVSRRLVSSLRKQLGV